MTGRLKFISILLPLALICSCQIEPPLHLRQSMKVLVKVLWKTEVYPDGVKPDGITLYFFRDGEFYMKHTTSEVDSCLVQLAPGHYQMYMISQSPEEYWKMEFEDMTDYDKARVNVAETAISWFSKADGDILLNSPELMMAGVADEFDVSEDLTNRYARLSADSNSASDDEIVRYYTVRVPVNPKNIVSQFWVTIYSDNVDRLKSVRASTSGMARTFLLTKDRTGDDEGTQVISEWSLTVDDEENQIGHLDGFVTTFGFPRGELPDTQRDSTLNVSTLLVDNKTVDDYIFYVGDKVTLEEPPLGYRYRYRLVFGSVENPVIHPSEVEPEPSGGGFTAGAEDWDNEIRSDIDI